MKKMLKAIAVFSLVAIIFLAVSVESFCSGGYVYLMKIPITGTGLSFNNPSHVAVDGNNNIYVADTDNHRIQKLTSDGVSVEGAVDKRIFKGEDKIIVIEPGKQK